jgi:hypothetical protein
MHPLGESEAFLWGGIYQAVIFEETYRREGEKLFGQWTI